MNMCFPSYLIQKRKLFSPFRYIFIVIFAIGFVHVYGQPSSLLNTTQTLPNFFTKENSIHQETSVQNETNNYWLPAVEVFGLNIFVWSIDRYVAQEEWARISMESMSNNLKHGFVWDADGFETNQLFHPYSGALSFTAARSSGLNFWQSLPYPFAGSLMWELFMENEYPSMNDIITTPMSGIVLGEISYRVSNLILFSGEQSFLRDLASTLISPMNGFNRLIGKGKKRLSSKHNIPRYKIALSAGLNGIFVNGEFSQRAPHLYLNYNMVYGQYTHLSKSYKPFDYFVTNVGASFSENNNIITIFSSGLLFGKNVRLGSNYHGIIGVFKNFNFLNNRLYKISTSSVGAGFLSDYSLNDKVSWSNSLIASVIVMGGINSLYAEEVGRDYNLGPGTSGKFESAFKIKNSAKLYLRYKHYWLHPLSGAKGNEYVDILMLGTRINMTSVHSISFEFIEYDRWSHYDNYPDLKENNFALRAYYSFLFQ